MPYECCPSLFGHGLALGGLFTQQQTAGDEPVQYNSYIISWTSLFLTPVQFPHKLSPKYWYQTGTAQRISPKDVNVIHLLLQVCAQRRLAVTSKLLLLAGVCPALVSSPQTLHVCANIAEVCKESDFPSAERLVDQTLPKIYSSLFILHSFLIATINYLSGSYKPALIAPLTSKKNLKLVHLT